MMIGSLSFLPENWVDEKCRDEKSFQWLVWAILAALLGVECWPIMTKVFDLIGYFGPVTPCWTSARWSHQSSTFHLNIVLSRIGLSIVEALAANFDGSILDFWQFVFWDSLAMEWDDNQCREGRLRVGVIKASVLSNGLRDPFCGGFRIEQRGLGSWIQGPCVVGKYLTCFSRSDFGF